MHNPAMSMSSLNRNIKKLARVHVGRSDTASDYSCSGSVNTGIRALCTPKAELSNCIALCCIYYLTSFCSDKCLMVYNIEHRRLYKLGFNCRCLYSYKGFSGEHDCSLRHSKYIAGKLKLLKVIQKFILEYARRC